VAYLSIGIVGWAFGWVDNQVEVGVGVGIECWWFYIVGLVGGKLMDVGSVVGVVVGSVVGVVVGSVGVVLVVVGSVGVVVGIVVEVVVGGSVVFAVVVTLEVAPTGCEGRPNSEVEKHAYLEL
jgi:hypothetical protein